MIIVRPSFSKISFFKMLSVRTKTKKQRFQVLPGEKCFRKAPFSWRISVDYTLGQIRRSKAAFQAFLDTFQSDMVSLICTCTAQCKASVFFSQVYLSKLNGVPGFKQGEFSWRTSQVAKLVRVHGSMKKRLAKKSITFRRIQLYKEYSWKLPVRSQKEINVIMKTCPEIVPV